MIKLSKGQTTVLIATSLPMAAVGVAGAVATFVNMDNVLHRGASALGLVAAGEGATLICALIALAVTLMGQHTPMPVRLGMWLIPLVAAATGVALAPNSTEAVVMAVTPMAMTAAGEGIAFVARRVVAYRTGIDIEQQRRSGLLVWHANRAANSTGPARRISTAAVWRLTKSIAATDPELAAQLAETQRFHIGQGASQNLAAVLTSGPERPSLAPAAPAPVDAQPEAPESFYGPAWRVDEPAPVELTEAAGAVVEFDGEAYRPVPVDAVPADGYDWIQRAIDENEDRLAKDGTVVGLLTGDEVAKRCNVKPGTVRSWVKRGTLRVHDKDASGRSLFHPDDVDKLG